MADSHYSITAIRERAANCGLEYRNVSARDRAELLRLVDEMSEALEEIANGEGAYGWQAHEYKQIARTALAKARGETT